jgi:4-amino-4-deoxy-L-arabinose transferase-like glycosyltransferase
MRSHDTRSCDDALMADRRFWKLLLLVVLGALAFRVGYVLLAKHDEPRRGDQIFYNVQADQLARGNGFTDPRDGSETAQHPPLAALVLTPTSWVAERVDEGGDHVLAQRLTMAVFGAGVVVLVALIGRRVAGERAGIIAAVVAALYPNLWMNDGLVMSETLAALAVALAILLAYRFWDAPSWGSAAWVGVAIGVAALARAELGLLLVIMMLPLALFRCERSFGARIGLVVVAGLATVLVVSPWVLFNVSRFDEPVFFSTNDGLTICGANSPNAYEGIGTGLWDPSTCERSDPVAEHEDAGAVSNRLRSDGIDYIVDHAGRAPVVVATRLARVWSLYAPGYMAEYNAGEGREEWASWFGFATFWLLVPFAVGGAVVLRRARVPITPLVAQFVMVTVTAIAIYGLVRFRVPAEVSLVVLAAVGIDRLLARTSRTSTEVAPSSVESVDEGGDPVGALQR